MPSLKDVFGIASSVPTYTYVDRASLDEDFRDLLERDRHIVIHGASKQGKTILRKKCLPEAKTIVVQCRYGSSLETVYQDILSSVKAVVSVETSVSSTVGGELSASGSGSFHVPFVADGSAAAGLQANAGRTCTNVSRPAVDEHNFAYLVEQIKRSEKRCVIEDFHYLPDDEQIQLARDLKTFWDASLFFIIVGVWAEPNLLTHYNIELSGRLEEIDVQWTDEELRQVLIQGQDALNIKFAESIQHGIVADAAGNVGLTQRLAEYVCRECKVKATSPSGEVIDSERALQKARERICADYRNRYQNFDTAVGGGFRRRGDRSPRVYQHIVRAVVEAADHDLLGGMPSSTLLDRIHKHDSSVTQSSLTQALNRLNALPAERKIHPPVLSYNESTRRVRLVDQGILFYRKYGKPSWSWSR